MIHSIIVTNYLDESILLELTRPELSGFQILSISGLGPVKADINTNVIAASDGEIFNMARLNSRNIVMTLGFLDTPTIEDTRLKTYKYFPIKKPVNITIETDHRLVEIKGYVESNEPTIFSKSEGTVISIICPDPYFYSLEITDTVFSGIEPAFEFEFENNSLTENLIEFGYIQNLTEQTVYYDGDADTGIVINIHALGDVGNITIYNTTTRESMTINADKLLASTGFTIISGDDITITTIKGSKSIYLLRNGVLVNILNCLDRDTDWFQISKGDNVFTYTADSGSSNLQFRILSKIVYEGV